MVECAGLEIRYTVSPYRGFESLLLRQTRLPSGGSYSFCLRALPCGRPLGAYHPGVTHQHVFSRPAMDTQQQQSENSTDRRTDQQSAEQRSGEGADSALQRMKSQERAKAQESGDGGSSHPNQG